jgi:hypothetical protein
MSEKAKDALTLAHWLERDGANCQQHIDAAALLRTQHADIERKDVLMRQALEAMQEYFDPDLDGIVAAITKELQ